MRTVVNLLKYVVLVLLQVFAAQACAAGKPYAIKDNKVDENTFQGWAIYQEANCGLCHGNAGEGIPSLSLIPIVKSISKEQFVDSVVRGKGLMPPFITDRKVVDNIDNIYAYLKARSDGALGEGKPQKQ